MSDPSKDKRAEEIQAVLNRISRYTSRLSDTSFAGGEKLIREINGKVVPDAMGLLRELNKNVDNKILNSMARDTIEILGSFYGSREVLCCLIKNMFVALGAMERVGFWAKFNEYKEQLKNEDLADEDGNIAARGNASFIKSIDYMIAVIDIAIILLQFELKDLILPILDFSQTIMNQVMGALFIALQQIIFILKDTAVGWVLEKLGNIEGDEAKCIPWVQFVKVLENLVINHEKYMHDHGLLSRLFKLFSGIVGSKFKQFRNFEEKDMLNRIVIIELLKEIRTILQHLKRATLNWEMCINPGLDLSTDDDDERNESKIDWDTFKKGPTYKNLNTTIHGSDLNRRGRADDNTILQDDENVKYVRRRIPNDGEISSFLINNLGLPSDYAYELANRTDYSDNVQGTMSSGTRHNNDCGYVMSNKRIKTMIDDILKSRGLI